MWVRAGHPGGRLPAPPLLTGSTGTADKHLMDAGVTRMSQANRALSGLRVWSWQRVALKPPSLASVPKRELPCEGRGGEGGQA